MENILQYITENALILVPVLYILSAIIKGTELIPEKYVPVILLPIGIIFSLFVVGFDTNGVIDGILVTGAAVYVNNFVVKKANKKNP